MLKYQKPNPKLNGKVFKLSHKVASMKTGMADCSDEAILFAITLSLLADKKGRVAIDDDMLDYIHFAMLKMAKLNDDNVVVDKVRDVHKKAVIFMNEVHRQRMSDWRKAKLDTPDLPMPEPVTFRQFIDDVKELQDQGFLDDNLIPIMPDNFVALT